MIAEPREYAFRSRRIHRSKPLSIFGAALVVSGVETAQEEVLDLRPKSQNIVNAVPRFGEDLLFKVTCIVVYYAIYFWALFGNYRQ